MLHRIMTFVLILCLVSFASAQSKSKSIVSAKLLTYDPDLGTIRATLGTSSTKAVTLIVAKDVKLTVDEEATTKVLADLPEGTYLDLTLNADKTTVLSINAEGPGLRRTVESIDLKAGTITVRAGKKEDTMKFDKDVTIRVDKGKPQLKLEDVKPGMVVHLRQSFDRTHITEILVGQMSKKPE